MFNTQVVIRALKFVSCVVREFLDCGTTIFVSGADVIPTVYANVVLVSFQSIVACLFARQRVCLSKEARGRNSKAVSTKIMYSALCARVRLTF